MEFVAGSQCVRFNNVACFAKEILDFGQVDTMLTWIDQVKAMAFQLMEISVAVTDEDQILALTMGLDESFVISFDDTTRTSHT